MKIPLLGNIGAIDEGTSGLLRRIKLDPPLLLVLLVTSGFGLVILYSAGRQNLDLVLRQGMRLGLGFVLMVVLAQLPPQRLRGWTPWIYLAGTALLVAVDMVGYIGKGAQRWLDLGFIRFQPSEIMKVAVPMMMAWYFADKPLPPRWPHLIIGTVITLAPVVLILGQPDLGTALLVFCSGAFALFLGGLSWRIIFALIGAFAAIAPLFWTFVMHDYQRQRVLTFLDPETDPLGTGYHIIQSKIAIGSGGIYGKGWLHGSQGYLQFLPESSTDFIFAVFAEEFGLFGVGLLLTLYLAIICRSLYIAAQAQDTYSRLLGGSLALIFFVYAFVNTGMVSGLLPVVGVPLPLISYGGTSLVTIMASFGILMSIRAHRKRLSH
ncbi:MAG TPA: rod shape-determining protein RodA [Candidatus Competibacteraceae bacterium]|nr:rod shape-determining protein RodA [Candidatus Competibacteraceae bacterium]